jgi:hypothetical protein
MSDGTLSPRAHRRTVTRSPQPDEAPDLVLKWRRHGDLLEGLVSHESDDGQVVTEWVTALRMSPHVEPADDVADEQELTAMAIAQAFDVYGQYHEEVPADDADRVELLGRIGSAIADARGATVGAGAVSKANGRMHVCLWLATEPEPD